MSDKIRLLKAQMIEVYGKLCWLDDEVSNKNILTFHHIQEKRNGGIDIWENGALITLNAHSYLNYLDREYKKIYKELNELFHELNKTYRPPTELYYNDIHYVLGKVQDDTPGNRKIKRI